MIPEEDRPPAWLRGYADLEVDLARMEDLAAQMDAEVRQNYIPHLDLVNSDVTTELPSPNANFAELCGFLTSHREVQESVLYLLHQFRDATGGLAYTAAEISKRYGDADAFARARLTDVERALDQTATARAPEPADWPTTGAEAS